MDVLTDVLSTLRLQGTLYFHTEFRAPWGLRVPSHGRVARFHVVARGKCWVRVIGVEEPVLLEAGDLIMVTRGAEHVLADTPDTPCRMVDDVVRSTGFTGRGALVMGTDDGGAPTRLVCGHLSFDDEFTHPFVEQLPPAIVVRADDHPMAPQIAEACQFIAREVRSGGPGQGAVVTRLSEVLFVQAVRHWVGQQPQVQGMIAALNDSGLSAALTAMHDRPRSAWTLESLAREAAMGRTAFAKRFREVMGQTPMEYLTAWRLQLAKRLLGETQLSVEHVAERVGYDSSASFSRVFNRELGMRPGAYRRNRGTTQQGTAHG